MEQDEDVELQKFPVDIGATEIAIKETPVNSSMGMEMNKYPVVLR